MKASKLTISKETIMKAQEPLHNYKRSELYMKNLEALAESGKLAMVRTRAELAEAIGFPYSRRANGGSQWVRRAIEKGVLQEQTMSYKSNGRAEYEYHLLNPKAKSVAPPVNPPILDGVENKVEVVAQPQTLTIYKGETTITLENIDKDTAVEIIKSIF